jgi:hypothetical protein
MRAAVVEWRAAEANGAETARATLFQQLWAVLGGTLAFWALGVLLLAPRQTVTAAAPASLSILAEPAGEAPIAGAADVPPVQPSAPIEQALPPPDLVPAAELCAEIARADSGEALAALVGRAADVIGASGVVVWLASGDELVPALTHGYGPHARGLLGTLPLSEENVTTRAWHSGDVQGVEGDARSRAALAAPMFQGPRRTGVLSVELIDGVEPGALPRALTRILAAQFATAVSPQAEPAADTSATLESRAV